ncbi:hypothetical protein, partial [Halomonas sp. A29]|uniref:hypothetical protein n=1 Tax=Halomonas sp. A29 TaxID=3102786 RepID=UPI00398B83E7
YALGTQRAAGYFATGAGFDAAGQHVQGGEYRVGQTLAAGGTALVYGPLAGVACGEMLRWVVRRVAPIRQ